MEALTPFQTNRLNEFVALHRVMQTALADTNTPCDVHHALTGISQSLLRELKPEDLRPIAKVFCSMELSIPYLDELKRELKEKKTCHRQQQ